MKTTQKRAVEAYAVLNQMGRKVTGKTAFTLFRLKRKMKEIVEFQGEEEIKLVEKHGGRLTEDGRIIFDDAEMKTAFQIEQRKLGEMECEIEPVMLKDDEIPQITMAEIEALDGFVIFE